MAVMFRAEGVRQGLRMTCQGYRTNRVMIKKSATHRATPTVIPRRTPPAGRSGSRMTSDPRLIGSAALARFTIWVL